MVILKREDIEALDKDTAQIYLDKKLKNKDLDKSLLQYPKLFALADELANEILYLEDHIRYLGQLENVAIASAARYGKNTD